MTDTRLTAELLKTAFPEKDLPALTAEFLLMKSFEIDNVVKIPCQS